MPPPKRKNFFSQQPKGRARQFLETNFSLPDGTTESTLCQNGHVFLQYLDNDKVFVHTAKKISEKFTFSPDVDRIRRMTQKASILMSAFSHEPSRAKFEDFCKEYFFAKPIASSSTTGQSDFECTPILILTEDAAGETSQSDLMQTDSQTTSAWTPRSEPFSLKSITDPGPSTKSHSPQSFRHRSDDTIQLFKRRLYFISKSKMQKKHIHILAELKAKIGKYQNIIKQLNQTIRRKETTIKKLKLREASKQKGTQSELNTFNKERILIKQKYRVKINQIREKVRAEFERKMRKKEALIWKRDKQIRYLDTIGEQLQEKKTESKQTVVVEKDKKTYRTDMCMMVNDCIVNQTPTKNILTVLQKNFNHLGSKLEVPSQTFVKQIKLKLSVVSDLCAAKIALTTPNVTLRFDATAAQEGDMDLPDLVDDEGMIEDPHHEDENGDHEVEGIAWDDDESDEEVGEDNIFEGPVKCLFCDRVLNSAQEVFAHSLSDHSFHVHAFCRKWSLDCLAYIRLINFIRLQHPHADKLNSLHPRDGPAPWNDDKFMVPADAEDLLLQYDIESDLSLASEKPEPPENEYPGDVAAEMDQDVTVRAKDLHALIVQKDEALCKVAILEAELQRALHDLECIRKTAQGLIAGEGTVWVAQKRLGGSDGHCGDKEADEAGEEACSSGMGAIQRLNLKEDEAYFSSYSDFNIHAEMLQDKVRTESYQDFIFGNAEVFRDKVVLDVGCGTGILSMFAAKAGAKHVIGVDMSDIIYRAMGIARENNLEEKITFLKGKMEDVKLPYEKVDVIISEWMGYFLLFESMLDTVIVARNNYLTPGGCVYPDKCSLWLAGFCDIKLMDKFINFWDDVYGFKMTCMKSEVVNQTSVDIVNKDCVITEPCKIKELDLAKCSLSDVDFTSNFTLTICRDGEMHGIVGYFDIGFELGCSKPIYFSTGPDCPSTHWKQTQFLLKTPIRLLKGATLEGGIKVKKNKKDPRSLDVTITLDGRTQEYIIE